MAMSFCARLESVARRTGSLLCVGLDPYPADLAEPTANAARDFCLRLVAATEGLAAAYKPNAAFFEALGPAGWAALGEVVRVIPPDVPVILDAKWGDIASSAEAYARSAFEAFGVDAVTLSPYLGRDSLEPFLADPARGGFVLCKTSNPGSADLQDLELAWPAPDGSLASSQGQGAGEGVRGPGAELSGPFEQEHPVVSCAATGSRTGDIPGSRGSPRLYEHMARLARGWNTRDNLGLCSWCNPPTALSHASVRSPRSCGSWRPASARRAATWPRRSAAHTRRRPGVAAAGQPRHRQGRRPTRRRAPSRGSDAGRAGTCRAVCGCRE